MLELTAGQILFMLLYPVIHCVLLVGTILLSLSAGFRKSTSKFPQAQTPQRWQKVVWGISDGLYLLLAAPLLLLEKVTRTPLATIDGRGLVFIALNSIFYAVIILLVWQA